MAANQETFDLFVRVKDDATQALGGIVGALGKLAVAAVAVRTLGGFLADSTKAAIESEKVWNDLGASIQRHGGDWSQLEVAMKAATSSLQYQTGLSDEALARSAQVFIDYGSNAKKAMGLVKTATDLAAGANMSLASATDLIAKASVGYTATLSRYGIILDESIPKAQKFEQAVKLINDRFGGAAAARMDTAAGQLALLNELYGDMQEQIGLLVSGPLTSLLRDMNTLLVVMNNLESGWDRFLFVVRLFGTAAANPVEQIKQLNDIMVEAKIAVEELKIKQQSIFDRYPDFNNNLKSHADAVEKVAVQYKAAGTALEEWARYQSDYQTTALPRELRDRTAEQDAAIGGPTEISESMRRRFEAEQEFMEESRARWEEYRDVVMGVTASAVDSFISQFRSGKIQFGRILQEMVADFIRAMAQMAIARAVGGIFGGLFPKPFSASVMAASAGGYGTSMAAAARPPSEPTQINFNGPVLASEDYIVRVIGPVIERASRQGRLSFVVR